MPFAAPLLTYHIDLVEEVCVVGGRMRQERSTHHLAPESFSR